MLLHKKKQVFMIVLCVLMNKALGPKDVDTGYRSQHG
jgi:hypothetical protein